MKPPPPLRLIAASEEDLLVIAAAVQDGLCARSDIKYLPTSKSVVIEMKRFQWEFAGWFGPFFRRQSALMIASVKSVRAKGFDQIQPDTVLNILSISFKPGSDPDGLISLHFAGGYEMEINAECLDVTLMDTEVAWPTRRKPKHKPR